MDRGVSRAVVKGDRVEALVNRAQTLTEALPYIKQWWGKVVVVKYGGSAMTDAAMRAMVAQDIVLMKLVGMHPVVVHGGGKDITDYMERLGMEVRFKDGLRVTDDEAMEVVKMVLVGKVNKELVAAINSHGRLAVGISGDDANLIEAQPRGEEYGRVGSVKAIHPDVVTNLIGDGFIPVVASVGYGADGGSYNINADLVAGEIAAALGSEKVVFLTDVDGLYADIEDPDSLISRLKYSEAVGLVESGALDSGMIPKVAACTHALSGGVRRAHILNGTVQHALLLEIFTSEGVGTMITHDEDEG
ncbi:MAG: acetylglutamate kinase [Coriobacteriia bacterium]